MGIRGSVKREKTNKQTKITKKKNMLVNLSLVRIHPQTLLGDFCLYIIIQNCATWPDSAPRDM